MVTAWYKKYRVHRLKGGRLIPGVRTWCGIRVAFLGAWMATADEMTCQACRRDFTAWERRNPDDRR